MTNKKRRYPEEYDFLKLAQLRGLAVSKKDVDRFKRVEAGFIGEKTFYKILQQFGLGHWIVLRNCWLNDYSDFECDVILITRVCVYVFEIKHYYGKFIYENGQCSSRGVPITYNPINQTRNAAIHLQNITHKFSSDIPVRGVLVFIGEHNHVEIKDTIDYIDILRSNEVYEYIQKIIEEEKYSSTLIQSQKLVKHYRRYEIEKPYKVVPYSREEMKKAKTGFMCANCHQFRTSIKGSYIYCDCGLREPREEAIVRSACEYGVLTFDNDFIISDIQHFLYKSATYPYLKKILTKHFEILPEKKVLTLRNYGEAYHHLEDSFEFPLPKLLEL